MHLAGRRVQRVQALARRSPKNTAHALPDEEEGATEKRAVRTVAWAQTPPVCAARLRIEGMHVAGIAGDEEAVANQRLAARALRSRRQNQTAHFSLSFGRSLALRPPSLTNRVLLIPPLPHPSHSTGAGRTGERATLRLCTR